MTKKKRLINKIFLIGIILLVLPTGVFADYGGQKTTFSIDPSYDLEKRQELSATLLRITPHLYFYIDDAWWNPLGETEKNTAKLAIQRLGEEFDDKIYPELTSAFGSEWKPGIDGDDKITILIHPMISQAGAYFNRGDEYPLNYSPMSNRREMIYFNSQHLNSDLAKTFLGHEFTHLITFNQKERMRGVEEDVWLNEARAEYSSTLLGYDSKGIDSSLNRRIRDFLREPSVSFMDWENKRENYGVLNLFTQYLVDHYGVQILADSLKSYQKGIESVNSALAKNGFSNDFDGIFGDWTITVLVNDCSLGKKYCYLNPTLKNFKLIPSINLLPLAGKSRQELTQTTKKWTGNWYKFIGGWGILKVEFAGNAGVNFRVPYVTQDVAGNQSLGFFKLDNYQKGEIYIPDFGKTIISLIIIPSVQNGTVQNIATSYPFFWQASTEESAEEPIENESSNSQNIQEVMDKITILEKQLAALRIELQVLLSAEKDSEQSVSCQTFSQDLYYGMRNLPAVSCLQEFLRSKGEAIYPEGLVSGNYLSLTVLAVKRYQASKGIIQTGYFGPLTRQAANLDK